VAIKDRIVARNEIKNCLMKIHVAIRTSTKTSQKLNNGSNRIDGTPYIPFKKMQLEKQGNLHYGKKHFIISNFIEMNLMNIIINDLMPNLLSLRLRISSVNQLNLKIELHRRTNCCAKLLHIISRF